jgi:PKD repeat protein
VSYTWAFGDEFTGSGALVTYTYPDVGIYTAVVTAGNSVNELTATTTVTIIPAIEYDFGLYLPLVIDF